MHASIAAAVGGGHPEAQVKSGEIKASIVQPCLQLDGILPCTNS
jgi:hypothetical protein